MKAREDRVKKEKPILAQPAAQNTVNRLATSLGCESTHKAAFGRTFLSFQAPPCVSTPFAEKAVKEAFRAATEEKPVPHFPEIAPTSLLLPRATELWEEVVETFVPKVLDRDIGLHQFGEPLNKLLERLLLPEYEARTRLSASLHHQTFLESAMFAASGENVDVFAALAKSHLPTLVRDLHSFAAARRECRKHVLKRATIRHEPDRLVNSSYWGEGLFPKKLVEEIMAIVRRDNTSVLRRWNVTALPEDSQSLPLGTQKPKKKRKHRSFAQIQAKRARLLAQSNAQGQVAQQHQQTQQQSHGYIPFNHATLYAAPPPGQYSAPVQTVSVLPPPSNPVPTSVVSTGYSGSPLAQSSFHNRGNHPGYGRGRGQKRGHGGRGGGRGRGQRGGQQ